MNGKRQLRAAAANAQLPVGAFTVLSEVIRVDGNGKRPPTFRELQAMCGGMSSATLARSLDHLARHGWVIREQLPGRGGPVAWLPLPGEICKCRPGRGQPKTAAQRKAAQRARQRARQRADVTLTESKDVTVNGSKSAADVTTLSVTNRRSDPLNCAIGNGSRRNEHQPGADARTAKDLAPDPDKIKTTAPQSRKTGEITTPRSQPAADDQHDPGDLTAGRQPADRYAREAGAIDWQAVNQDLGDGYCARCKRWISVQRGGMLREHKDLGRGIRCSGSQRAPAETAATP